MCFYIRKRDKVAKVAEKDIHCFKVLTQEIVGKRVGYISPSRSFSRYPWRIGKVKHEKKLARLVSDVYHFCINQGLHSKKTKRGCLPWLHKNERRVFKAIIPAGSLYWENRGEYVSDALCVIGKPLKYGKGK